jgi:uncharacterized membrane protein YkvA (DUF1232 family)
MEKRKREWAPVRTFNIFRQTLDQTRLAWALFTDSDMPLLYKLIPILTVAYILSPIDLVPEWLLGLLGVGLLDDVGVFILGISAFNQLAPGEVALDHIHRLRLGTLKERQPQPDDEADVEADDEADVEDRQASRRH